MAAIYTETKLPSRDRAYHRDLLSALEDDPGGILDHLLVYRPLALREHITKARPWVPCCENVRQCAERQALWPY